MNLILYVPITIDGIADWKYCDRSLEGVRAFIEGNEYRYKRIDEFYCRSEDRYPVVEESDEEA
jgi:hypothetical protein